MEILKRNAFWIGIAAVVFASIGFGAWQVWGGYDAASKAKADLAKKQKSLESFSKDVPRTSDIAAYEEQRKRAEEQFQRTRESLADLEKDFDDVYFQGVVRNDIVKALPRDNGRERAQEHFESIPPEKADRMFIYPSLITPLESRLGDLLRELETARLVRDDKPRDERKGAPGEEREGRRDDRAGRAERAKAVLDLGQPSKGYSHPRQVAEVQKRFWVLSDAVKILKEKVPDGELEKITFSPPVPSLDELRKPPAAGAKPEDEFFKRIAFKIEGKARFSRVPGLVQGFLQASPLTFRVRGLMVSRVVADPAAKGAEVRPERRGGPAAADGPAPGTVRFTLELEALDWEIPEKPF